MCVERSFLATVFSLSVVAACWDSTWVWRQTPCIISRCAVPHGVPPGVYSFKPDKAANRLDIRCKDDRVLLAEFKTAEDAKAFTELVTPRIYFTQRTAVFACVLPERCLRARSVRLAALPGTPVAMAACFRPALTRISVAVISDAQFLPYCPHAA